jgi:putative ABC transport system substrate-binding protein
MKAPSWLGALFLCLPERGAHLLTSSGNLAIFAAALAHKLPVIAWSAELTEAGALMSYGANVVDLFRHTAVYIDKVLKGTNPADIPVEQPMQYDFVVNLKTAKALGITIPPSLLARADEVIE